MGLAGLLDQPGTLRHRDRHQAIDLLRCVNVYVEQELHSASFVRSQVGCHVQGGLLWPRPRNDFSLSPA